MNDTPIHVGLDVHKQTTAVAVSQGSGRARFVGTVDSDPDVLLKVLGKLGDARDLSVVYEAGPCGYELYRRLRSGGYQCEVIAPSKLARRSGDRVKTDRRDALHLAEQSRAGALTSVWVLDESDEAMRLRVGRRYSGRTHWTAAHERYLAEQTFAWPAQNLAWEEYRQAVSEVHRRVERLTESLHDQVGQWRRGALVKALMTLRGIDQVSATTLVAELGDLRRFAHARELMGFVLPGAERTQLGGLAPHREDYPHRQRLCPPDAGGGRLELPFPGPHQPRHPGAPGRSAAGGPRDCLAGPGAPEPPLPGAQGPVGPAQQDLRGGGPGTGRLRLVDRPAG